MAPDLEARLESSWVIPNFSTLVTRQYFSSPYQKIMKRFLEERNLSHKSHPKKLDSSSENEMTFTVLPLLEHDLIVSRDHTHDVWDRPAHWNHTLAYDFYQRVIFYFTLIFMWINIPPSMGCNQILCLIEHQRTFFIQFRMLTRSHLNHQ